MQTYQKEIPGRDETLSGTPSALKAIGKKQCKIQDWFGMSSSKLTPVFELKRAALLEYKR